MLALGAPLALSACSVAGEAAAAEKARPAIQVEVAAASRMTGEVAHVATGAIRGQNTATLTGKVRGYVRSFGAAAGQSVEAGQVLVTLDPTDAKTGLQSARAMLAEAMAAGTQAEHNHQAVDTKLTIARTTHSRMEKLVGYGAISQQEFDVALSNVQVAASHKEGAKAAVLRAASRIQHARAALDAAETMLGDTEIRAPFAGRVLERPAQVGDLASPGTPLIVLEEATTLQAHVAVPESLAKSVHLGEVATVEIGALDTAVAGTVAEIVPAVDAASRAFLVKLDLSSEMSDEDLAALRPGMFARVRFTIGQEAVLRVPADSVSKRGSLERVFVAEEGYARLRLVTLGESRDGHVEVLSGLDAGEWVVRGPSAQLRDGKRIAAARSPGTPGAPGARGATEVPQ